MRDSRMVFRRIDGRGYKAYQELRGVELEPLPGVHARFAKVQSDPFAPPSIVELDTRAPHLLTLSRECHGCLKPLLDFVYRRLHGRLRKWSRRVGEGHSGELSLPRPGPIVIWRRAVRLSQENAQLTVLVRLGLPSQRRRILGREAAETLERAARALLEAIRIEGEAEKEAREHARLWRVQQEIREWMSREGVFSFVAEGSILPRKCGGCEEPLEGAVPFEPPSSMAVEVETPSGGIVRGMALPQGLTLVLGPAFHGKTTLAEAIAQGVWDHVRGDGRELVLTERSIVVVQSENRRHVSCVDLRPWFASLPGQRSLECFSTTDASGSTSMASTIMEYMEAGARGFIVDEDTSASNFIHRDRLVERLVGSKTLVSLSENAPLLKQAGYSLLIVATGVEDLAQHADAILVMHEYRPIDVTRRVKELYPPKETRGEGEGGENPFTRPPRRDLKGLPRVEKAKLRGRRVEARGLEDPIDLDPLWQLEEESQFQTLVTLVFGERLEAGRGVGELAGRLAQTLFESPLPPNPSLVEVRPVDVAFLLNRIPGLGVARMA